MRHKLICILYLFISGIPVLAQPAQMSIQGILTDDEGAPLAGPVNLTLRLYAVPSGPAPFFSETHPNVPLEGGLFNVSMGSITNLAGKDFSRDVYLGIQVNSDPELTPRTLLTGTASAMTLVVPAEIKGYEPTNGALTVHNQQTTGTNYGVLALSDASTGRGVYGYATHTSGSTRGLYGRSNSSVGVGVYGYAWALSGATIGVSGLANSDGGTGGRFEGSTGVEAVGSTYGVLSEADHSNGVGVSGRASSTTGLNAGVVGNSASSTGRGVIGEATSSSGDIYGVYGTVANSPDGIGVLGVAGSTSGETHGVEGRVSSAAGYAGYFDNLAAGGYGIFVSGGPRTTSIVPKADILLDAPGLDNLGTIESTGVLELKSGSGSSATVGSLFEFYASGNFENKVFRVHSGGEQLALYTDGDMTIGGTLTQNSDRNAKQDIEPVDASDVLSRLVELPVSTWRYKDDPSVLHMGPMAQDFYRLFRLGEGETGISTLDTGGAAIAAIQGLVEQIRQRDTRIDELEERLRRLEEAMGQ